MVESSKNSVALRVWGDWGLFTRPEAHVERYSYPVITPSAARGILEAVCWKKDQMEWVVEKIFVVNPIRFSSIMVNEVCPQSSRVGVPIIAEDAIQQRVSTILKNPEYIIFARYNLLDGSQPSRKHYEMFKRRAQKGQCWQRPCLGCREFAAHFEWHEGPLPPVHPELRGTHDLGLMFFDLDYNNKPEGQGYARRFYHVKMVDGLILVEEGGK